jgi:hypothetical protein
MRLRFAAEYNKKIEACIAEHQKRERTKNLDVFTGFEWEKRKGSVTGKTLSVAEPNEHTARQRQKVMLQLGLPAKISYSPSSGNHYVSLPDTQESLQACDALSEEWAASLSWTDKRMPKGDCAYRLDVGGMEVRKRELLKSILVRQVGGYSETGNGLQNCLEIKGDDKRARFESFLAQARTRGTSRAEKKGPVAKSKVRALSCAPAP